MKILLRLSTLPDAKRRWAAITITFLIVLGLTAFTIYALGAYGPALFFLSPLLIGISCTILYGYNHKISGREAFGASLTTLFLLAGVMMVLAMEGLFCIVMASPLIILAMWVGTLIGQVIVSRISSGSLTTILVLAISIPLSGFVEEHSAAQPGVTPVTTSITIHASRETVWKNVIAFPQLPPPTEFLFRAGIAYPINATITGTGKGAVRSCNFTTGNFIEPITVWEEPALLRFDVLQSPPPMTEISFWEVDAPHLHDYFVSKTGQFKLIKISDQETRLEGTTWYYNRIRPNFYWNLWSDYIVHKIHERVLNHIKNVSEKQ